MRNPIRKYLVNLYISVKKIIAFTKIKTLGRSQREPFLRLQINRFFDHIGLDNSITHTKYLLPVISELDGIDKSSKLLIIGPCNHKELDAFEAFGYDNYKAIDLVSTDSRISVMDMHDLAYNNETFDLIYATNVIHCTEDPKSLGDSIYRVLKMDGYLVLGVTIDLAPDDPVYVKDYKTVDGILEIFPNSLEVIYQRTVEPKCEENPHANRFLKCILQK
jgi:SAM-dependent methyltransferase